MLIWTIPTVIRIYQAVTGKVAPFGIATVDPVCQSTSRCWYRSGLSQRISLVSSSKGLQMHLSMVIHTVIFLSLRTGHDPRFQRKHLEDVEIYVHSKEAMSLGFTCASRVVT